MVGTLPGCSSVSTLVPANKISLFKGTIIFFIRIVSEGGIAKGDIAGVEIPTHREQASLSLR